ncbi:MAG: S41 family peptidase [Pseudomonadota bacterium]
MMFKRFIATLTLLGSALAHSATAPATTELTGAAARADVELAREALMAIHAGYDRYVSEAELESRWDVLRAAAEEGMTRGQLYFGISEILAQIRCDHTKAELPKDIEAARQSAPIYLPFRYQFFDGRMFVTEVGESVPLARETEIVAIDGQSVGELIAAVSAVFPVDGDTDYIKEHSIANFGEFMGPAFEHFMPYVYDLSDQAVLSVVGLEGSTQEVTVDRVGFEAYAAITGEKRFSRNFVDAVRFETLGDDAAYLAVDTFVNYRRPINPDKLYKPIFRQLAKEGRDKLIVDLRLNGGGSNDAAWGLFQWLINEPVQPTPEIWTRFDRIEPELREHLSTWEERVLEPNPKWFEKIDNGYYKLVSKLAGAPGRPLKPKRGAFEGEIIMLTSFDNASGVTHLLSAMRGIGRATFVGEPTGGAATGATAGYLAYLTLPESGIRVRIPLQRTIMANADKLNPRGGIMPDVVATPTRETYFAGQDVALEKAKAMFGIEE